MDKSLPARIVIQYPTPAVDGGAFPVKRCAGDRVTVRAEVLRDGHELLRACLRFRGPVDKRWHERPMRWLEPATGALLWEAELILDRIGRWEYSVDAWVDRFGTWRDELRRKLEAGTEDGVYRGPSLAGELSEGAVLLRAASERASEEEDQRLIAYALAIVSDDLVPESAKHDVALGPELHAAVERGQERAGLATLPRPIAIEVDRVRARFGSWYELFPRSWGGLKAVRELLPAFMELGVDVLYMPPIHPIGMTNRKGRNNALEAEPGDPGSPYAIGNAAGGHEAVHLELGTVEDVRELCSAASDYGIDIALDFAIQFSPDHPWLKEHPEWFQRRPDGTLKYAENPPKRYQDIYNVDWDTPDWQAMWDALLAVVLHWVDCGVKVFRVDNPHTKPFPFWEWLIARVHERDREVVFLAEAFTKREVMRQLAKLGFSQSYTYFTWRNTRAELTEYVTELAYSGEQEYFRPNFFVNTPDILHAYLQHGGRPAFEARLVLAATLSPSYGIYSGFERIEHVPLRPGSEEYLDSEKYELKRRSLNGELLPMVASINRIRRENPALQELSNVTFCETANASLIAYCKQSAGNTLIIVVNLDPHGPQAGLAIITPDLGLPASFAVDDLLSGDHYQWSTGANYVRLAPGERQAHILRVLAE